MQNKEVITTATTNLVKNIALDAGIELTELRLYAKCQFLLKETRLCTMPIRLNLEPKENWKMY